MNQNQYPSEPKLSTRLHAPVCNQNKNYFEIPCHLKEIEKREAEQNQIFLTKCEFESLAVIKTFSYFFFFLTVRWKKREENLIISNKNPNCLFCLSQQFMVCTVRLQSHKSDSPLKGKCALSSSFMSHAKEKVICDSIVLMFWEEGFNTLSIQMHKIITEVW